MTCNVTTNRLYLCHYRIYLSEFQESECLVERIELNSDKIMTFLTKFISNDR